MAQLKITFATVVLLTLTSCQMAYVIESGFEQAKILRARVPIEEVQRDPQTSEDLQQKLKVVKSVLKFAKEELAFHTNNNYETYVDLKRPYVTWTVVASHRWRIKAHTWHFPIVGEVPYLGFFDPDDAKAKAQELEKIYDVNVGGVRAYSSLGWFEDPVLSTMLTGKPFDLAELLLHELTHANIYVAGDADFNERIATFLGQKSAFLWGKNNLKEEELFQAEKEVRDQKKFSQFLTQELRTLEEEYEKYQKENGLPSTDSQVAVELSADPDTMPESSSAHRWRQSRLVELQNIYLSQLKPKLETDVFDSFAKSKMNNARLLGYKIYLSRLDDFDSFYQTCSLNLKRMIEKLRDNPKATSCN